MVARSLQAETEGITLDSCDKNFDLYMEKLRNIKLDTEKSWNMEDKMLACCWSMALSTSSRTYPQRKCGPY